MGQPLDQDIAEAFIHEADSLLEFSPPSQHSIILLEVKGDLSARTIWVSINSPPRLLFLWGRVVIRLGSRGWRRGPKSGHLLGRFYTFWDLWNLWQFDFFTQKDGFLFLGGGGLTFLFSRLRREASTLSSPLGVIRGPYTAEVPAWHCTEHLILWYRPVAPGLRPGSSLASRLRSSEKHQWQAWTPGGEVHQSKVGHSTIWRPPAGQLAAWRLPPCKMHDVGPGNCCHFPPLPWRSFYWLSSPSTLGVVGAKPGHFHCNPPVGVVYRIWFFLTPWFGSWLGSTNRWFGWYFRLGPSYVGRMAMGSLWTIHGIWSRWAGSIISLCGHALYEEKG